VVPDEEMIDEATGKLALVVSARAGGGDALAAADATPG
jgi:hypothetical protein